MRTIGLEDAERYARRLRSAGVSATAQTILFGPKGGDPQHALGAVQSAFEVSRKAPIPRNFREVPVLSWVSAGQLADASSQIPVEDVPLLAFADLGRGEFFALKVRGD